MTKQLEAQLNKIFGPEPKEHNGTTQFEMEEFYMIYVEGKGVPTLKHEDIDEARKEAERLAAKEGRPTYLLTATHVCLPPVSKLDVLDLVEKAIKLGQHDIAKALLTCSILVDTASEYMPKEGLASKIWFETAATLKL
jgi:hypothetical protein